MQRKHITGKSAGHTLGLIIAGGIYMGTSSPVQAATEKKSYVAPPFSSFSSQMRDALTGTGKYEKPVWNLHDALDLPEWLSMSLEQRTRYETLDGSYKANSQGGDQQIAMQINLSMEARFGHWRVGGEFLDSRQFGADQGSRINNTHVNEADFIQGYLAWADQNAFHSGLGAEVIAGRQTLNIGSRRLIARNVFRNTINTFDGLRLRVLDYGNWQFNAFVTKPVGRYPNNSAQLLDHFHSFDEPEYQTWFSGGFLEIFDLPWKTNAELYLYHLDEGDRDRNPTSNRRYFTPGMRVYRKPAKEQFDFELEAIGQIGTVRASKSASDGQDLQHRAWYQSFNVGYTFDLPWSPRLSLEYDYASGDRDPNDGKDERFDTLYGARRFQYGPTGIYGTFARSNINTPGYRIKIKPRHNVQAFLSHRFYWLAEDKDAWTTANLRDKTGNTGNFVGHQLELATRWNVNSSFNLETGWAHLFKGEFAKNAPSAPEAGDLDYFYVQSLFRF